MPTIWTLAILTQVTLIIWTSNSLVGLLLLVGVLPVWPLLKICEIKYDDKNVYISNYRKHWTYELVNVKSINEGTIPFDPFFELEIIEKSGHVRKIDFMPKVAEQINYMFTDKLSGRLLDLKIKIRETKMII
jgi:hypothetical protein